MFLCFHIFKTKNVTLISSIHTENFDLETHGILFTTNYYGQFCNFFLYSLKLEKTNDEQRHRIQKTERALKVAEVCVTNHYHHIKVLHADT